MSLLSLIHDVMPPLNHHSHTKFKSLAYGRRYYCLLFLKMIPKPCKIWKLHLNKKKLRNLNIFQTVYHLLHSDLSFRSNCKNSACKIEKSGNQNHLYLKLLLNGKKSANMINMKKLHLIHSFLMPYHLHQSDKRFENAEQNSVRKWKIREIVIYHI
jgi:hypothetical protein